MKKLLIIVLILVLFLCSCEEKQTNLNFSSSITKHETDSSTYIEKEETSSENQTSVEQSSSKNETSSKVSTSSKVNNSSKTETSSKVSSAEAPSIKPISSNPSVLNKDPSGIGIMFTPAKNKIPLTAVHPENYYALNDLKKTGTEAEIKAYRLFAEKIGNYENVIEFDFSISEEETINAFYHYIFDYPQHFWRGFQTKTYSKDKDVTKVVVEDMICGGNKNQIKELDNKFKAKIKSILSGLSGSNSSLEKEIFIHNYIVNNSEYIDGKNAHNSYGIIVDGKGICEGYAKAFMVLMREAGVQCILIDGTLTADLGLGYDHQWNMVEIDGEYYHIDVTADDPIVGGKEKVLKFDYFNVTESDINRDHKIEHNFYPIPKANSNKYNFFNFFGLKFNSLNIDNLAKSMAFAATNNLSFSHGHFSSFNENEVGDFLVDNYYDIINKSNEYLGVNKIKANGKVDFISNNPFLSVKISY